MLRLSATTRPWRAAAILLLATSLSPASQAALPIDLEVVVVPAAPIGAMQEWGRVLSELDLARLRLRGARAGDKPSVAPAAAGASQRVVVMAVLNDRDQLILPGHVFGRGDLAHLKQYFQSLPEEAMEQGVERGIFGLTKPQFAALYEDFMAPVAVPTKDVPLRSAVDGILAGVSSTVEWDPAARAALGAARPLAVDLKGFSSGTSLAIALRSAGLGLIPAPGRGASATLRVARPAAWKDCWPTGWKPDQTAKELAPAMYRVTTIEIEGFTLAQALEQGLAPNMGVPLVLDDHILAARQIDLAKDVKFPRRKTYIRRAVDYVLSQARLAGEMRVDEAERPFYWITQFGPDSLRGLGAERTTPPAAKAGADRAAR